jgi:hypothetical protein
MEDQWRKGVFLFVFFVGRLKGAAGQATELVNGFVSAGRARCCTISHGVCVLCGIVRSRDCRDGRDGRDCRYEPADSQATSLPSRFFLSPVAGMACALGLSFLSFFAPFD